MAVATKPSILDNTVDMIQMLNDDELQAIQSVARVFIAKPNSDRIYKPLTEDQIVKRIDASLEQVSAGMYEDSEIAEQEIIAEFGL